MQNKCSTVRVMSTESGSFASARTVVQLYLDNKDLGQVLYHGGDGVGDGDHFYQAKEIRICWRAPGSSFSSSPCSFRQH